MTFIPETRSLVRHSEARFRVLSALGFLVPLDVIAALRRLTPVFLAVPMVIMQAGCQSHAPAIASTPSSNGATNISIGTRTIRENVKHLGINLSGQTFYDSGQMLRNLSFRNPGFEGEIWQTVLQCKYVKDDSCADDDEWSSWPKDFAKGAAFEFFYGAAKGQTGTVSNSSVAASTAHQGTWISFGKLAAHPRVGDFYILRMRFPGGADLGWRIETKGGATITTEFQDISRSSPGKQSLRLNAGEPSQSASITSDIDTWADRSFVQLKGACTLSFRAKGTGGNNTLNVSVIRLTSKHGNLSYFNRQIPLSSSWQDFKFPLNIREDGSFIGPIAVAFGVQAGSALLDDASFSEDARRDNPTVFRNAVVDRLRELRPGILRYMDNGTSFGSTIDNLLAPPFARQRAGYGEGPHEQADIPIGLHEFLVLCQAVKAEPWFVLPIGITPAEMQNLIEYLSAPPTTSYGTKRTALGQATPWTQVFPTIHLELGNETWNWNSFAGEGILEPKAYGTRASQIFTAAKTSPLYDPNKFDLVMNGWWAVPSWTEEELKIGTRADTIDIAPYTFNPFDDASSPEAIFGPMFAEPESMDSRPTGLVAMNAKLAAQYGVKLASYEVNLGTSFGKASQAALESTVPSLGAGLSVADNMLLMLRDDGVINQALFSLPEYANGFNNSEHPEAHELVKLWGSVVDMGGQTNRVRPTFLAEELANDALAGKMIETVQSGSNPTWNQPESPNGKIKLNDAHLIQSFAFTDGDHCNLVLLNLSRSAALPVIFSGQIAPHGTVNVSRLTSAKITDNNETAQTVDITHSTLPSFNPAASYSLPPYSMTVLSWDVSNAHISNAQTDGIHPATHPSAVGSKP
jgi:hypothetical protein